MENDNLNNFSEEEFEADVVVNVPEEFPKTTEEDTQGEHPYKGNQVAEKLGVTRQTISNYARDFGEVLDIELLVNGTRLYSDKSIQQIAFIYEDMKQSGRDRVQELRYLRTSIGQKSMELATTGTEGMMKLFTEMQNSLLQSIQMVGESQQQGQKDLMEALKYRADLLEKNEETEKRYMEALERRDAENEQLLKRVRELEEQLEERNKPFWKRKKK